LSQLLAVRGCASPVAVVSITFIDNQEARTMNLASRPTRRAATGDAVPSSRAMAWMGGVFAIASLAALAVALVLEGPAVDAVLPDGTPTAATAPR
jgi:hypothetical protein